MSVTTLHRPTHRDALGLLETAFGDGRMATVFGRCSVEYDGRASSSLGPGDRLVVCKPDGTVLVHTDEKRKPVNWQPPGCTHRASVRDGRLRIRSERTSPPERLDVAFERIEQVTVYEVTDRSDLTLTGSEEDLRQRILEHPELVEPGFVPTATERETTAGPVDVFGRDDADRPVVVELKRRRVGPSAASQLRRYVEAVDGEFPEEGVRGILVAPSVTDRAAALLEELHLSFVPLTPVEDGNAADGAETPTDGGERRDARDGGEKADAREGDERADARDADGGARDAATGDTSTGDADCVRPSE
ncbi:endonuclease NucS [Halobellus sp. GM3]|uniref:endonuclease NucS n=1 Tax=Halobellus sp. GM3 TaxID=3458410 RepID=UPI00403DFBDF